MKASIKATAAGSAGWLEGKKKKFTRARKRAGEVERGARGKAVLVSSSALQEKEGWEGVVNK